MKVEYTETMLLWLEHIIKKLSILEELIPLYCSAFVVPAVCAKHNARCQLIAYNSRIYGEWLKSLIVLSEKLKSQNKYSQLHNSKKIPFPYYSKLTYSKLLKHVTRASWLSSQTRCNHG